MGLEGPNLCPGGWIEGDEEKAKVAGISGEAGLGEKRAGCVLSTGGELVYVVFDGEEMGTETAEKKMEARALSSTLDTE